MIVGDSANQILIVEYENPRQRLSSMKTKVVVNYANEDEKNNIYLSIHYLIHVNASLCNILTTSNYNRVTTPLHQV